ncbi:hypothetical protein V6N12_023112 [Hibiscus sabdariffa]|uniref:Uncharacterized protein n=1 Tax=Hibiscus sabdariffa TaxID=183260 RepID=A0ABR2FXI8_9ROSI
MVSVLTSSAVSKALLFLALCSVWLLPDLALAKHAGILPGTTSSMGWSKAYTETIINQAWATGGAPNISDAFTINGLLGPSYKLQLLNKRPPNAKFDMSARSYATFDNTTSIRVLKYEKSAPAPNSNNKEHLPT